MRDKHGIRLHSVSHFQRLIYWHDFIHISVLLARWKSCNMLTNCEYITVWKVITKHISSPGLRVRHAAAGSGDGGLHGGEQHTGEWLGIPFTAADISYKLFGAGLEITTVFIVCEDRKILLDVFFTACNMGQTLFQESSIFTHQASLKQTAEKIAKLNHQRRDLDDEISKLEETVNSLGTQLTVVSFLGFMKVLNSYVQYVYPCR